MIIDDNLIASCGVGSFPPGCLFFAFDSNSIKTQITDS